MTDDRSNKTYKCSKVMQSCVFASTASKIYSYCDYLSMTGHRRGCNPEECDKYVNKNGKRKRRKRSGSSRMKEV